MFSLIRSLALRSGVTLASLVLCVAVTSQCAKTELFIWCGPSAGPSWPTSPALSPSCTSSLSPEFPHSSPPPTRHLSLCPKTNAVGRVWYLQGMWCPSGSWPSGGGREMENLRPLESPGCRNGKEVSSQGEGQCGEAEKHSPCTYTSFRSRLQGLLM